MKNVLLAVFVVILAVATCLMVSSLIGGGTDGTERSDLASHDAECQADWNHLNLPVGQEGQAASLLINQEQLPGTYGEAVKECLLDGWRWDQ
jgi:hypothetical protein